MTIWKGWIFFDVNTNGTAPSPAGSLVMKQLETIGKVGSLWRCRFVWSYSVPARFELLLDFSQWLAHFTCFLGAK